MYLHKCLRYPSFILASLLWLFAHPGYAISSPHSHKQIMFHCVENIPEKYFCANISVINPSLILRLPRLEQKRISGYVNAFRIMPSITNLTKKTIVYAKIRLKFWNNPELFHDFVIQQKIIPNDKSHTNISYLIRNDVPVQTPLYGELLSTIEGNSYEKLILELLEIKYLK